MKQETVSSAVRNFAGTSSFGGFLLTSVCIIQNHDTEGDIAFHSLLKSNGDLDVEYFIVDGDSNELPTEKDAGSKNEVGSTIQTTSTSPYGGKSSATTRVRYPKPRPIFTFKDKLGNGVFKTEEDWNKATRRARAALTVGSSFRHYGRQLEFFEGKSVDKPLLKRLCNHFYSQIYLSDSFEYEKGKNWCVRIGSNEDNIRKTRKRHFVGSDYDRALEIFEEKKYNYAVDSLKWMLARSPKDVLSLLSGQNTRKVEAIRDWCGSTLDLEFFNKMTQDYHSASEVCFL